MKSDLGAVSRQPAAVSESAFAAASRDWMRFPLTADDSRSAISNLSIRRWPDGLQNFPREIPAIEALAPVVQTATHDDEVV